MKKRLIVGLLTGGLLTAMLSIGAAAGNAPDHVQGSAKFDPDWHI